ncbi:PaaI family thioesterase [Sphingobium sp. CAP-1]|uniref:PaaI family thioesterase n=1 Tax=Sphingobium sp. CAP-1 TaxID=2676077 RepID=UPI001E565425|nr:PaaI family thioesterase [Sphingobium sp. CAP-1]
MSESQEVARPVADGKWAGWLTWVGRLDGTFINVLGPSYFRPETPSRATVALETAPHHRNPVDSLHGGMLAAFADHAYFAALVAIGKPGQVDGVTVDLTMQYLGGGQIGPDLMAEVDLLQETGRMLFMRMLMTQEGRAVAASTATIRKVAIAR